MKPSSDNLVYFFLMTVLSTQKIKKYYQSICMRDVEIIYETVEV